LREVLGEGGRNGSITQGGGRKGKIGTRARSEESPERLVAVCQGVGKSVKCMLSGASHVMQKVWCSGYSSKGTMRGIFEDLMGRGGLSSRLLTSQKGPPGRTGTLVIGEERTSI